MGKFDKDLREYMSKMGFQVEKHDTTEVEKILKAVIYRLVRNIMRNIVSVMTNTRDTKIDGKHIETTGRVCKKCVQRFSGAPGSHRGGGTVLPLEYFSGVLSPHYTPENVNDYQSTEANGDLARQGLEFRMAGGKPSDLLENSFIRGFIEMLCIPKFFRDNKIKHYAITECAMKKIVDAVHENVLIIFDHVYKSHCGKHASSSQCLLNLTTLVKTLRSPNFAFLR